jgi:hypothetical protein
MTMLRQAAAWKVAGPVVVVFVALLAIGACGNDSGSCDYLFSDVPSLDACGGGRVTPENPLIEGSLQERFDCGNAVYTASTEGCQLIACNICEDVDADFDGDVDDDL